MAVRRSVLLKRGGLRLRLIRPTALVPAIHGTDKDVDARDERGHDETDTWIAERHALEGVNE